MNLVFVFIYNLLERLIYLLSAKSVEEVREKPGNNIDMENSISIKPMGTIAVVDPKGIVTKCNVSYVSEIKNGVVVSEKTNIRSISLRLKGEKDEPQRRV